MEAADVCEVHWRLLAGKSRVTRPTGVRETLARSRLFTITAIAKIHQAAITSFEVVPKAGKWAIV
jgi:hypothetical protein